MNLDFAHAEDRGKVREEAEFGQGLFLLILSDILLEEQEEIAKQLTAVEGDLHVLLQPLGSLQLVLVYKLSNDF